MWQKQLESINALENARKHELSNVSSNFSLPYLLLRFSQSMSIFICGITLRLEQEPHIS